MGIRDSVPTEKKEKKTIRLTNARQKSRLYNMIALFFLIKERKR